MGYGSKVEQARHPIVQAAVNNDCHSVSLDEAVACFALFSDAATFGQSVMSMGYTHLMLYDDGGMEYRLHWEA